MPSLQFNIEKFLVSGWDCQTIKKGEAIKDVQFFVGWTLSSTVKKPNTNYKVKVAGLGCEKDIITTYLNPPSQDSDKLSLFGDKSYYIDIQWPQDGETTDFEMSLHVWRLHHHEDLSPYYLDPSSILGQIESQRSKMGKEAKEKLISTFKSVAADISKIPVQGTQALSFLQQIPAAIEQVQHVRSYAKQKLDPIEKWTQNDNITAQIENKGGVYTVKWLKFNDNNKITDNKLNFRINHKGGKEKSMILTTDIQLSFSSYDSNVKFTELVNN